MKNEIFCRWDVVKAQPKRERRRLVSRSYLMPESPALGGHTPTDALVLWA